MNKFPTEEDMQSLYSCFPIESFKIRDSDFANKQTNCKDLIENFNQVATIQELRAWKCALHNKWNDVAKAYTMMMFYYNQGIPDEPYFISPGRNVLAARFIVISCITTNKTMKTPDLIKNSLKPFVSLFFIEYLILGCF